MYDKLNCLLSDSKVKIYVNGILDYVGPWKDFKFKNYFIAKDVLRLSATEMSDFVVIGYYKDF